MEKVSKDYTKDILGNRNRELERSHLRMALFFIDAFYITNNSLYKNLLKR